MPEKLIDKQELSQWRAHKEVEFCSERIPASKGSRLLKWLFFYVRMDGRYRIEFASKTLYEGDDFEKAKAAYNAAG